MRDDGIESLAVAALAVLTGSSDAVQPVTSLAALAEVFDLAHISRNPARFDPSELAQLSARTLHALPYPAVSHRLAAAGVPEACAEQVWLAVRGNLERFADVEMWWSIIQGPIVPTLEDPAFLAGTAELLPPEPWNSTTWGTWTGLVKNQSGRKGKALFHPLRLALTGRDTGPELAALLPLIGRATAAARLAGQHA